MKMEGYKFCLTMTSTTFPMDALCALPTCARSIFHKPFTYNILQPSLNFMQNVTLKNMVPHFSHLIYW